MIYRPWQHNITFHIKDYEINKMLVKCINKHHTAFPKKIKKSMNCSWNASIKCHAIYICHFLAHKSLCNKRELHDFYCDIAPSLVTSLWYIAHKAEVLPGWGTETDCICWQALLIVTLIARFIGPFKGPIWGRQAPGGPHVGPMNFAIWVNIYTFCRFQSNVIAPLQQHCIRDNIQTL